jgi:hypothetical protein
MFLLHGAAAFANSYYSLWSNKGASGYPRKGLGAHEWCMSASNRVASTREIEPGLRGVKSK